MKGNTYTFIFAFIVCVVCGVLLSAVSEGFREKQELNSVLDVKKNILKAVRLDTPINPKANSQEVLSIYDMKIQELVIDDQGNVVEGRKPSSLTEKEKNLLPLYVYKEGDEVKSYAFPVTGQGLWSALYGYLALDPDVTTIRGITFYKHGETPGLGGEIEKEWFQNNFKGKKIWSSIKKQLMPTVVVKGRVADVIKDAQEAEHYVDGITAATLTANGVTELMSRWIKAYDPYFSKLRKI